MEEIVVNLIPCLAHSLISAPGVSGRSPKGRARDAMVAPTAIRGGLTSPELGLSGNVHSRHQAHRQRYHQQHPAHHATSAIAGATRGGAMPTIAEVMDDGLRWPICTKHFAHFGRHAPLCAERVGSLLGSYKTPCAKRGISGSEL